RARPADDQEPATTEHCTITGPARACGVVGCLHRFPPVAWPFAAVAEQPDSLRRGVGIRETTYIRARPGRSAPRQRAVRGIPGPVPDPGRGTVRGRSERGKLDSPEGIGRRRTRGARHVRRFLVVGCGGSGGATLAYMMDQLASDLAAIDRRYAPGGAGPESSTGSTGSAGARRLPPGWQLLHLDVQ